MRLDTGDVVRPEAPFETPRPDGTKPGRPWLIVSNDSHPFHGTEYIVLGMTTTQRSRAVRGKQSDTKRAEAHGLQPWVQATLRPAPLHWSGAGRNSAAKRPQYWPDWSFTPPLADPGLLHFHHGWLAYNRLAALSSVDAAHQYVRGPAVLPPGASAVHRTVGRRCCLLQRGELRPPPGVFCGPKRRPRRAHTGQRLGGRRLGCRHARGIPPTVHPDPLLEHATATRPGKTERPGRRSSSCSESTATQTIPTWSTTRVPRVTGRTATLAGYTSSFATTSTRWHWASGRAWRSRSGCSSRRNTASGTTSGSASKSGGARIGWNRTVAWNSFTTGQPSRSPHTRPSATRRLRRADATRPTHQWPPPMARHPGRWQRWTSGPTPSPLSRRATATSCASTGGPSSSASVNKPERSRGCSHTSHLTSQSPAGVEQCHVFATPNGTTPWTPSFAASRSGWPSEASRRCLLESWTTCGRPIGGQS